MIREVAYDWKVKSKKGWENQGREGEHVTPVLSPINYCRCSLEQALNLKTICEGQLPSVKEYNFMNVKHAVAEKDSVFPIWINKE